MKIAWVHLSVADRDPVAAALRSHGAEPLMLPVGGCDGIMEFAVPKIADARPDLVLLEWTAIRGRFDTGDGALSALQKIKYQLGRRVACWCEEIRPMYPPHFRAMLPAFDHLLFNHRDKIFMGGIRQLGFRGKFATMYGSVDPAVFTPSEAEIDSATPPYEVVFAGNRYTGTFPLEQQREQVLRGIDRGCSLAVAGGGWGGFRKYVGLRTGQRMIADFLRQGQLVFGMNQLNLVGYYPKRLWESLASGRGTLYCRVPGMTEDFQSFVPMLAPGDDVVRRVKELAPGWKSWARQQRTIFLQGHTWAHHVRPLVDLAR